MFDSLQAVVVHVREMERSQRFYRDVIELEPMVEDRGVSVYSTGNSEICLVLSDASDIAQGTHSYPNLRSSDATKTRATLESRGVKCGEIAVSGSVTWFSFRDPDGNRLDCCEFNFAPY